MKNKFKYMYSISSDKGPKPNNEDAAWIGFNKSNQCFAIICDGISSEKHSDKASKLVVDMFKTLFSHKKHIWNPKLWFNHVLYVASAQLNDLYRVKGLRIGTTIVLCLISNGKVYALNIGDSRLYHFTMNQYKWIVKTKDHNLFNFLVDNHAPQASFKRHANNLLFLTNFIDSTDVKHKHMKFNYISFDINYNDVIFLSSDGLYNFIELSYVNKNIHKLGSNKFKDAMSQIIQKALNNHSNDNLSGIIIQLTKGTN